jgi:hypothetical protein
LSSRPRRVSATAQRARRNASSEWGESPAAGVRAVAKTRVPVSLPLEEKQPVVARTPPSPRGAAAVIRVRRESGMA